MKFDLILPITKADYNVMFSSLPYVLKYLKPTNIIVIGSSEVEALINRDFVGHNNIIFRNEDTLIDGLSFNKIKEKMHSLGCDTRTGWYFQQFLKLGYSKVTTSEYYLSWDADMIPLRDISFFDKKGVPYFGLKKEFNEPYFITIHRLFGLNKMINDSFVAEHMIFKKTIVLEMIEYLENKFHKQWWDCILSNIDEKSLPTAGFSEFETYGTYIMSKYPEAYNLRRLKAIRCGKRIFGDCPNSEVLLWLGKSYDTISFEKWDKRVLKNQIYDSYLFRKIIPASLFIKSSFAFIKFFRKTNEN